jgi:hypothetical protein
MTIIINPIAKGLLKNKLSLTSLTSLWVIRYFKMDLNKGTKKSPDFTIKAF